MNEWIEKDGSMSKTFEFSSFEAAMDWMSNVGKVITKLDHHPAWSNTYNKVHVQLTTHDAGNMITEKDRQLALEMDEAFADSINQ
ncbi:MAG: 4a-hydroxytetrahydrobiopterin dehydratase [Fluviicola sp.]|nr:4a-hydroxytetrahydrobiopterin dehydratase [Fluviicola sp.]MBP6271955.1 4a-hydroxytetrahydrobiopterin dehydratase [Fluviicola sp.]